ncbi:MAG: COG1470 family protein [Acidimicrobiales bacterium]
MGATASLSERSVPVEPGATVTCELKVRNTGSVVDQFDFTVLGDTDGWLTVEPTSISLFPGTEGAAQVRLSPPRDPSVPAGDVPFAIKISSREDPAGSVVEEGTAQIGAFSDLFAELVPRASRGRRAARHDLAIDNRGNSATYAELRAGDPDDLLVFAVEPQAVDPAPGTATFARLKVGARKRIIKGPPMSHPFQVLVQRDGAEPVPVDGTFVQEAVIPPWGTKALMAVLAALLLFLLLWFALLRPSIKSAAKDAVDEAIAPVAADAAAAKAAAGQAAKDAGAAAAAAEKATGTSLPTTSTTAVVDRNGGIGIGSTYDGRLFLTKPGIASFAIPERKVFELTDLIIQNPAGNSGAVNVRRNGTPLLVLALENFRDHDYHFVSPVVFKAGDKLELSADCKAPPDGCSPGLYFSGVMKDTPAA